MRKLLRLGALFLTVLCLLVLPLIEGHRDVSAAKLERQTVIDTFADMSEVVGALYSLEDDGDLDFLCSATAVGTEGPDTIILTAYHCVRKGVSYLINFGDNNFHPLRIWQVPHYELDDKKYPRAYGEPKTDMALFLEGA